QIEASQTDLRSEAALAIARQAVSASMVLLKNEHQVLPLKKDENILLLGLGSDNIGIQSGGWTIDWQGSDNLNIPGTTIKSAFESVIGGKVYTDISDIDKVDKVVV